MEPGAHPTRDHYVVSLSVKRLSNGSTVVSSGRRRARGFIVGTGEMVSGHHTYMSPAVVYTSTQVQ